MRPCPDGREGHLAGLPPAGCWVAQTHATRACVSGSADSHIEGPTPRLQARDRRVPSTPPCAAGQIPRGLCPQGEAAPDCREEPCAIDQFSAQQAGEAKPYRGNSHSRKPCCLSYEPPASGQSGTAPAQRLICSFCSRAYLPTASASFRPGVEAGEISSASLPCQPRLPVPRYLALFRSLSVHMPPAPAGEFPERKEGKRRILEALLGRFQTHRHTEIRLQASVVCTANTSGRLRGAPSSTHDRRFLTLPPQHQVGA